MANNYTKTMRQALQEAREYRDTTEGGPGSGPQKGGKKFSSSEIKKAYGILNDPRYKQGNYTGAAKAINKLAPGLADHPDVKNAMKRANENLDLPATGDTTTSNASQEVEQVEDLKEYTGMSISKSVNSNDVATALKNLKKGTKLYVQGKSQGGMRTMGDVVSVSGDTVKIKPTASNGPTSVKVKDITMMDTLKEELTAGQKKLPPALQKAIAKKNKDKKERVDEMMKMNAMKMPIRAMKTGDDDMTPDALKLNAMVKDPHKSSEENPKKDLNAKYMKSDVRADVKNGGGADMSKVQDAPKMMTAMKKINAMYNTEKYLESKSGSLNDVLAQMHLNEQKSVSIKVQEFSALVETYLAKGGVVGNISEAVREVELNKSLRMVEVREFITTYNLHFLTNYAAEEFILTEKKAGYIDIKFNSSFEAKRMMTWLDKNISPVNNQLYDGAYREGQSIIQFEDVPNVDALMKKLKSARINFKVDTMK